MNKKMNFKKITNSLLALLIVCGNVQAKAEAPVEPTEPPTVLNQDTPVGPVDTSAPVENPSNLEGPTAGTETNNEGQAVETVTPTEPTVQETPNAEPTPGIEVTPNPEPSVSPEPQQTVEPAPSNNPEATPTVSPEETVTPEVTTPPENAEPVQPDNQISPDNSTIAGPEQAPTSPRGVASVKTFATQLAFGAENVGGNYVWKPVNSSPDHKFAFRVNYEIAAQGVIGPEEVKITIPTSILNDKDGNNADYFEMSVPSKSEIASMSKQELDTLDGFAYEVVNEQIVVYNFKEMNSMNGYFEVAYATERETFYYNDFDNNPSTTQDASDEFYADLWAKGVSQDITRQSDRIRVYIDTTATLDEVYIYNAKRYPVWQSQWGPKPADADNYHYLLWEVRTNVNKNSTASYDLAFKNEPTSPNGTVENWMYKFSGEGYKLASQGSTVSGKTSLGHRYDQIVTRMPKSVFGALNNYKVENKLTVTITPSGNPSDASSTTSSKTFNWTRPEFHGAPGNFRVDVIGNENWHRWYGRYWDYARYDLDILQQKEVPSLGDIKFNVDMEAFPFKLTLKQGGNDKNPYDFGYTPVKYSVTDDTFYLLKEGSTNYNNEIYKGNEEGTTKLANDDYDIQSIEIKTTYRDVPRNQDGSIIFNEDEQKFTTSVVNPQSEVIEVFVKVNDAWVKASDYNPATKTGTTSTYVTSVNNGVITFADGVDGYRLETINNYYGTNIVATPKVELIGSANVSAIIDQQKYVILKNAATIDIFKGTLNAGRPATSVNKADYTFKDTEAVKGITSASTTGTDHYGKQTKIMGDRLIRTERASEIIKRVTSTKNIARKKQFFVTWNVNMKETITTGMGETSYLRQDGGVFYDLLPVSSILDKDSVIVRTEKGFVDKSEYSVELVDNYKQSGRTLLKVTVNPQGQHYSVFYDTIHDWDSIKDYGRDVLNPVAYKTGNAKIFNGTNDDGGALTGDNKKLMAGLTQENDGNKFIYDESQHHLAVILSATTGLVKKVKTNSDTGWYYETMVDPEDSYSYQIRYQNTFNEKAKNLIIYDSLESYDDGTVKDTWQGTLTGIDLTQIKEKGINPVVYVSTTNVDVTNHRDLSDASVWTRWDGSTYDGVKSIAIDCRTKTDGSEFVLGANESLSTVIYMKTPKTVATTTPNPNPVVPSTPQFDPTDASNDLALTNNMLSVYNEENASNGKANLVDGSDTTIWHSRWSSDLATTEDKRYIEVTFDTPTKVNGVRYLSRPTNSYNGNVTKYRVEYKAKATDTAWTSITTGDWGRESGVWRGASFPTVTAEKVRLIGVETIADSGDNKFMSAAEFRLTGPKFDTNEIPLTDNMIKVFSQQDNTTNAKGNLVDNKPNTIWHTRWDSDLANTEDKRYIEVTFDTPTAVNGVRYLPRPAGNTNGTVTKYRVEYKAEPTDNVWSLAGDGVWSGEGGKWQEAKFAPVTAKQIRLVGVETIGDTLNNFMSGAEFRLTAPEPGVELKSYPVACNNVFVQNSLINDMNEQKDYFINFDSTSVKFRASGDFSIKKVDADNLANPIQGIKFRLSGISNYGTNVDEIITSSSTGLGSFKDIEAGAYILQEYEGHPDWQEDHTEHVVVIDDGGNVTVDGTTASLDNPFVITNKARAHTDVVFQKKDLVTKTPLEGVKFKLSGMSGYGNEILMYATSAIDGSVKFPNLEYGSYTLTEIETVKGYVLPNDDFQVVVDENSNYDIKELVDGKYTSILDSTGEYVLFNEPFHKFRVVKRDAYSNETIAGAKFRLWGTSNNGNPYDKEVTSTPIGFLEFTDLEAGTYLLQETFVPTVNGISYILDDTKHVIVVSRDGSVTMDGEVADKVTGNFTIFNNRNKQQITIKKVWSDDKDNSQRKDPVIKVSTQKPAQSMSKAYWRSNYQEPPTDYLGGIGPLYYLDNTAGYKQSITSFERNITLSEADVIAKNPVRLDREFDNPNAQYKIYGWVENGAFYWWSNAEVSLLTNSSNQLFTGIEKIQNIDVTGIDTSEVTDMSFMFHGTGMNSSVFNINGINNWNVNKVTNMKRVFNFSGQNSKKWAVGDLSNWNVSNVNDMSYMFAMAGNNSAGLGINGLQNWKVNNVINMNSMFSGFGENVKTLELNLSEWDVSKTTDMSHMFEYVGAYKIISPKNIMVPRMNRITSKSWYDITNNKEYLPGTFPIGNGPVSHTLVDDPKTYILAPGPTVNAKLKEIDNVNHIETIEFVDTVKPTTGVTEITGLDADGDGTIVGWYTINSNGRNSTVYISSQKPGKKVLANPDSSLMFEQLRYLKNLDLTLFDTILANNMEAMFSLTGQQAGCMAGFENPNWLKGIENFDTRNVTNMSRLFEFIGGGYSTNLIIDFSNWNVSNVTNMSQMFYNFNSTGGSHGLSKVIGLENWDTGKVTNMSEMFSNFRGNRRENSIGNISTWNTSNVTNMSYMFSETAISHSLDLSSWNVGNVVDMSYMFFDFQETEIFSVGDLSKWDTGKVTNMSAMFSNAGWQATTWNIGNLSRWNVSNVTNMSAMFFNAGYASTAWNVGNLSNWDTSNVINMSQMFRGAGYFTPLTLDLSGWDVSKVTSMTSMFEECGAKKIMTPKNISMSTNILDITTRTFYDITDNNKEYLSGTFPVGNGPVSHTLVDRLTYELVDGPTFNTQLRNIDEVNKIKSIDFTDIKKPIGVIDIIGLDNDGDNCVVGWYTVDTDGKAKVYVSTQKSGQKVLANPNSSHMFNGYVNETTKDLDQVQIVDVTKLDMTNANNIEFIFCYTGSNNTSTFEIRGLNTWNTSKVTNMSSIFWGAGNNASTWNVGNISSWNTSAVTTLENAFYGAGQNSKPFSLDLSGWDGSKLTTLLGAFDSIGANEIKTPKNIPSTVIVDYVTSKSWFNRNEANKEYVAGTFPVGNGPISHTLVDTKPTTTYELVDGPTFNENLQRIETEKGTIRGIYFTTDTRHPSSTEITSFDADGDGGIVAWTADIGGGEVVLYISTQTTGQKVIANVNSSKMFDGRAPMMNYKLKKISTISCRDLDTSKVKNGAYMFAYTPAGLDFSGVSQLDFSSLENAEGMFSNSGYTQTSSKNSVNLQQWDFSKVTNMNSMFESSNFNKIYTPKNIQSSVTMSLITSKTFYDTTVKNKAYPAGTFPTGNGATSHILVDEKPPITYELADGVTVNTQLKDLDSSFKIKTITFTDTQLPVNYQPDIIGIDADGDDGIVGWSMISSIDNTADVYISTRKAGQKIIANQNISSMFSGLNSLEKIDVKNLDTSKTVEMNNVFENIGTPTNPLTLDLSNWDAKNVTTMNAMFKGANVNKIMTPKNIAPVTMNEITSKTFYDTTDGNKEYMAGTFPKGNGITSHALVDEVSYNISYDVQNGVMPSNYPKTYSASKGVGQLPIPTREGYIFKGWAMEEIQSTNFNFTYGSKEVNPDGSTNLLLSFYAPYSNTQKETLTFNVMNDGYLAFDYRSKPSGEGSSSLDGFRIGTDDVLKYSKGYKVTKGSYSAELSFSYRLTSEFFIENLRIYNEKMVTSIPIGSTGNKKMKAIWEKEITKAYWRDNFDFSSGPLYYLNNSKTYQQNITGSFSRNTSLTESQVVAKNAVRLDKEYGNVNAKYKIYGWIENGNFYWWSNADITALTNYSRRLFYNLEKVKRIDVNGIDVSEVTNMGSFFNSTGYFATEFTIIGLSSWDTSNVTDMSYMFPYAGRAAKTFNIGDISNWNVSNVTNMNSMFYEAGMNASPFKLDLGGWDASSVTDMAYMFGNSAVSEIIIPKNIRSSVTLTDITTKSFYDTNNGNREYIKGTFPTGTGASYHRLVSTRPYTSSPVLAKFFNPFNIFGSPALAEEFSTANVNLDPDGKPISWVKNGNVWTYDFYVNDPDAVWYAWEESSSLMPGYSTDHNEFNAVQLQNRTATITNYKTNQPPTGLPDVIHEGNLEVQKVVNPNTIQNNFTFTLTLSSTDPFLQDLITGTKVFGDFVFTNGTTKFSLKGGQKAIFTQLPEGLNFEVTEKLLDGFDTVITGQTGTIAEGTQPIVVSTSTQKTVTTQPVNVTITKRVEGHYENGDSYNFNISLSNLAPQTTYTLSTGTQFTSDSSGNANISTTLAKDESVTIQGLPAGSKYRVIEDGGQYTSSFKITDTANLGKIATTSGSTKATNTALSTSLETADEGEQITVVFTNYKEVTQKIRLANTVIGSDLNGTYQFELTFSNLAPYGSIFSTIGKIRADEYGNVTVETGLVNGDVVEFFDVPVGTKYQFKELPSGAISSFQISDINNKNQIVQPSKANTVAREVLNTELETVNEGEEVTVTFVNSTSPSTIDKVTETLPLITKETLDVQGRPMVTTDIFRFNVNQEMVEITGAGVLPAKTVEFTQEGDYIYRISEINPGDNKWVYDSSEYVVTYSVYKENGLLKANRTIKKDGLFVNDIVFKNQVPTISKVDVVKSANIPSGTKLEGGREIVYNLEVKNTGNVKAPYVALKDMIPSGTVGVAVAGGNAGDKVTLTANGLEAILYNMEVNEVRNVTMTVKVKNTNLPGVTIKNIASYDILNSDPTGALPELTQKTNEITHKVIMTVVPTGVTTVVTPFIIIVVCAGVLYVAFRKKKESKD